MFYELQQKIKTIGKLILISHFARNLKLRKLKIILNENSK